MAVIPILIAALIRICKSLVKRTGGLEKKRVIGDYPEDRIIKMVQKTEKNPEI